MTWSSASRSAVWIAFALLVGLSSTAEAIDVNEVDVEGRSYLTIFSFAQITNGDCFEFKEDGDFIASFGLIIGEWTNESETIALFFTVNFVEVEILSATDATITAITALDNRIIAGKVDTDDGDSGFFIGVESDICAFPAKTDAVAEDEPALTPVPDPKFTPTRTRTRR
jgi:hypothetical protein